MERLWEPVSVEKEQVEILTRELGISSLIASLLVSRDLVGVEEVRAFLSPRLNQLADPTLLKGMTEAVARILRAMDEGERIVVWGDYDVDGVTSTTLMLRFFSELKQSIHYFVPNRFVHGYGLSADPIRELAAAGTQVIITVDCGISDVKEVALAKELGMDVIVVDHHEVPATLPDAIVIDPLQPGCDYPFKGMAAVGLTFHLLVALRAALRERGLFGETIPEPNLKSYLDITAIGTIADLAPLRGVNRVLTQAGLRVLERTVHPGVQALRDVCMRSRPRPVDAGFVGFQMGPRINAAGRLASASRGVEMLVSDVYTPAVRIAEEVDEENNRRKEIQEEIFQQAVSMVEEMGGVEDKRAVVLHSTKWHAGVTGIVCSKLVDLYHRPFILIAVDEEEGKASGRSIRGFHLVEALTGCSDLLVGFGGHAHAAGLTIRRTEIPAFAERINQFASEKLTPAHLQKRLTIHGELRLRDVHPALLDELSMLEPYGMANAKPCFQATGVRVVSQRVVRGGHLQLRLAQDNVELASIAFGRGDDAPREGAYLDVAFYPELNHWKGRSTIQLQIKDFRLSRNRV